MKHLQYIAFWAIALLLSSCGKDRTGEWYALIEDRMWIEDIMRENYLWAEDMPVIEKEDPMILESSAVDSCNCCCGCPDLPELPECVLSWFDDELVLSGECRRLLVTIGQFSIIRLERDTQLLVPCFDYCIPTKVCSETGNVGGAESPCDIFGRIEFPVDAFYPARNEPCISPCDSCTGCYKTINGNERR